MEKTNCDTVFHSKQYRNILNVTMIFEKFTQWRLLKSRFVSSSSSRLALSSAVAHINRLCILLSSNFLFFLLNAVGDATSTWDMSRIELSYEIYKKNKILLGWFENFENYKNYKILQGQQRQSTQKCKWVDGRPSTKQRKLQKLRKLQELQNFAKPTTKIDAEMQMSRWKAINETAKITKITKIAKKARITKFCKASNENRRRSANESMEGHQRNSKNYKNCENYKNYKILQGQQRKSTQKCKWVDGRPSTKQRKLQELPNFARPTNKKLTVKWKRVKGRPWTNHLTCSIMSRIPIPGHLFPWHNIEQGWYRLCFHYFSNVCVIMHHSTVTKSYLVK